MTNTEDLESWLGQNGCFVEDYGGYLTDVKQTLMQSASIEKFMKFITDYKTHYSPIFIFKRNTGVGRYTYHTLGGMHTWGMVIMIDNAAEAPGVVADMGYIEELTAWFAMHETTRKFVKGLIIFGIGFAAANEAAILAKLPGWAIVPIGALITAAANYIQTHTTLPIVGASGKRKR